MRVALLLAALSIAVSAGAGPAGTAPDGTGAPAGVNAAVNPPARSSIPAVQVGDPPADLVVTNRPIVTLRATVYGASPADRVAAITEHLNALIERGGASPQVSLQRFEGGYVVHVNGELVFRVLDQDVDPESNAETRAVAEQTAAHLAQALAEMREGRDVGALLPGIGYTALATLALAGVLWLLRRGYRWTARAVRAAFERHSQRLAPGWTRQVFGAAGPAPIVLAPIRLLVWLLGLGFCYQWAGFVLRQFPYTRPWGETLRQNLFDALGSFGFKILQAIPGLLFVVLIFLIARLIVRVIRTFFDAVRAGRIEVAWVDQTTARPTGKLVTGIIWLLAIVAAYPYIPGSSSEAFKGIGVFVGLMLSIGSSGIVNQAVSGLMLMYTRALRPGEFVQIGETEGVVTSIGFLTTRIETLRHEEISLPNALIAASVTRNLSRLARDGGLRIPTKVTIGYDAPWRQVHEMLRLAAARTAGLVGDPPPRVLQTALLDFYVEYTLMVTVADPTTRPGTLSELHANIQDVFNEHGVQIMSPNYEADPEQPKVVRREDWYAAPASRDQPAPGSASKANEAGAS